MYNKIILSLLLLFAFQVRGQQFIINEIDSDTPSVDILEFVEIKSAQPFASLNGHVLVFYNGNTTGSTALRVYYSIDLSGLTTDANGLVVIGNVGVNPTPSYIIPNSTIQNGPDVVAIFQGDIANYQEFTLASPENLVHAIGHGNTSAPPTQLMQMLGITIYAYENQFGRQTEHSIQRNNDGTYSAALPTPGALNDGSGIVFNNVKIIVDTSDKNEGDIFPITFTTSEPVTQDLNFTYSLNNGNFNGEDYIADLNVTIAAGTDTTTKMVELLNDGIEEGDESLRIKFGAFPAGYIRYNDFIYINVIDRDFVVSDFGTPLNPTFGSVVPTYSDTYYSSLNGLAGADLKQAIQDIIADPTVVRKHDYGDIVDILKKADQNPLNSNAVWLLYSEMPRAKNLYQLGSVTTGYWNREHIFPQSRGGFANGTSTIADGIDIWELTDADDIMAGHADAHHIRAEAGNVNSSRGNKDYGLGDYNGPAGNAGSWKGDVARSLFYMAVRYNLLSVVNGNPPDTTRYQLGDLATLLEWNQSDPSDDFEMNRNNYIQTWQYNRNPFIDMPALADYIWGNRQGEVWMNTLTTDRFETFTFSMYPNPATNEFTISGLENQATVSIFNMIGQEVATKTFFQNTTLPVEFQAGVYLVKVRVNDKTKTQKLIVK